MNASKSFISNLLWSVFGQFSFMIILFISNFVLANYLTPTDFGKVGVALFIVNLSNILVESGMGGALIRKANVAREDYTTLFWFNFTVSIFLYILLFFSSPYLAIYYKDGSMESVFKVCGLILLINSFQICQNTKLIRELNFKRLNIFKTISALIASFISIISATYFQIGLWSIVLLQLSNIFVNALLLNYKTASIYRFEFNLSSFKSFFHFGANTTLANILTIFFDNIYSVLFAKNFSFELGGFFFQAKKIIDVPQNVVNSVNQGVFFSTLSKIRSEKDKFETLYRMMFKNYVFVIGLIFSTLFLFSSDVIEFLLSPDWYGTIPFLRVFSVIGFFFLLEQFNRVLFKVFNLTHVLLRLEVLKKILQSLTIVVGLYFKNIDVFLYGYLFTSVVGCFINFAVAKKLLPVQRNFEIKYILSILVFIAILCSLFYYSADFTFLIRCSFFLILYLIFGTLLKLTDLKEAIYKIRNG